MRKILGVIPARYASTRFPEKMLCKIDGKTLIQRTFEQASLAHCVDKWIIATDHPSIVAEAEKFGADVVLTKSSHVSGTDRCYEAFEKLSEPFDFLINVQGDEPLIEIEKIQKVAQALQAGQKIVSLAYPLKDHADVRNPNQVKVVLDKNQKALYFSRSPIPFVRGVAEENWAEMHNFYGHVGIYGFAVQTLRELVSLEKSSLEQAESLEQLRWLENGYAIHLAITPNKTIGVDTPEDVDKIIAYLRAQSQK